jgi:hypothetical protein
MTEDLQRQVNQGAEAAQLLDNPAFHEMFERLERENYAAWKAMDLRDTKGQELMLQRAKLTDRMKAIVFGMVEQGKLASAKIPIDDLRGESAFRRGIRKVVG